MDGYQYSPTVPRIGEDHQGILCDVEAVITGLAPALYPQDWVALNQLPRAHDDALVAVVSGRCEWIGRATRAALTRPGIGRIGLTERADRWATHPFWGLVILAAILGFAFWLTCAVGTPLQEPLDTYVVGDLTMLAVDVMVASPCLSQASPAAAEPLEPGETETMRA